MAANPTPAGLGIEESLSDAAPTPKQQLELESQPQPEQKQRRSSWFDRFHKNKQREHAQNPSPLSEPSSTTPTAGMSDDGASIFTTNTINSRLPLLGGSGRKDSVTSEGKPERPKKEKRESMSERGPFRIEYTASGLPIAIENKDWPPGVSYKTSSQIQQLKGMGQFYEGKGAIAAGGETAANIGPDPDWVPGLSEEERKKLKNSKSGNYVF